MMNNIPDWLTFALLWALVSGFFWFMTKVMSENKGSDLYFFIIYNLVFSIIPFFLWNMSMNYMEFMMAMVFWMLSMMWLKSSFASLNYMNSSTYFMNYSMFSSMLMAISWYLFFSEYLSLNDFIWMILWMMTFLLMMEKKEENEKMKDLKKWFILLFIWIMVMSVTNILQKYVAMGDLNLFWMLFYQWMVSMMFMLMLKMKTLKKEMKQMPKMKNIILYIFLWLFSLSPLFMVKALETWSMMVVYKIFSYSMFMTMFLSMIFYKEKMWIKKMLAFILAIMSMWFFL